MYRILRIPLLALPVLAAIARPADAAASDARTAPAAAVAASAARVGSPSAHGAFVIGSAAQINAVRGDSSADVRLSTVLRSTDSVSDDAATLSLALVASAPLGSDGGATALASLDGLAGGTTVGLQLSGLAMRGARTQPLAFDDAVACKQLLAARFATYELTHPEVDAEQVHCESGDLQRALDKGLISRAEYQRYIGRFWAPDAGLLSWSLGARAGYVDSTWYDATTLAPSRGRTGQWSASAQIGRAWLNWSVPTALVATLSLQSAPEDAASRTACLPTPAPGQPLLACASGPIGAPTRTRTGILSLEARAAVSSRFAVELQASRDLRNHLNAVHLPLYFLPSDPSGLSGGLVLGWTSEDHKASLGVFVSQSFSVL